MIFWWLIVQYLLSNHKIIIARLDGQLVVKRVLLSGAGVVLVGDGKNNESITITADRDFEVWGVVTYIIRQT